MLRRSIDGDLWRGNREACPFVWSSSARPSTARPWWPHMRVRWAVLGVLAVGLLLALPNVGIAAAEESTQTATEVIEKAHISLAYPSSWQVTTSEVARQEDGGALSVQFAAEGSDGSMKVVIVTVKGGHKEDRSAKAFKNMTNDLRAHEDKDFKLLYAARQKLGDAITFRSDLGMYSNTPDAFRQSDTNIGLTGDSGKRMILLVTVYTPLDDQGKALTDRILASMKRT